MSSDPLPEQQIVNQLKEKAYIKAMIYDQALEVFNQLKEVLSEMSNDLNDMLEDAPNNRRIRLEYRDIGKF